MKSASAGILAATAVSFFCALTAHAGIVWQNAGPTSVVNGTSEPVSFSSAALGITRDNSASDTLYFTATVKPTTDHLNENYFGGFQLFQTGGERFAVGNNWGAYAWSVFGGGANGDLNSANPEPGQSWQLVDRNDPAVKLLYRVNYAAGGNDSITVWLNPIDDTEANQPANLTTAFSADASFDEVRLRLGTVAGMTWEYSDMGIATTFNEALTIPEPGVALMLAVGAGLLALRRRLRIG
jgi:hypothetical protein